MQTILAISSYVAHGTVGLQATVPPLQMAGRNVIAIPTIVLSNHPGYKHFAGEHLAPSLITSMVQSLKDNGCLDDVAAVFSGYLPTADHVDAVCQIVAQLRVENPNLIYVCDPILGDDPSGIYIDANAAKAIRTKLIPLADVATPNSFELAWLTGQQVESVGSATTAARALGVPRVAITSVPTKSSEVANLLTTPSGAWVSSVEKKQNVPHGTGDLFAGLLLSAIIDGTSDDAVLGYATSVVDHVIGRSSGGKVLQLAGVPWAARGVTLLAAIALPS